MDGTCVHCTMEIVSTDGVWTHVHSNSIFCDSWQTLAAPAGGE